MQKLSKVFLAVAALVLATAVLTGCAQAQAVDVKSAAAVIDVRTPDEYSMGHLKGAINIDVENPGFNTQILTLDKSKNYIVYCHSGRRAGIAISTMQSIGFTGTLTNAGGIDEATGSTGLPIVTN